MILYFFRLNVFTLNVSRLNVVRLLDREGVSLDGRVYSSGKNFTGKINPTLILPVKRKFYP